MFLVTLLAIFLRLSLKWFTGRRSRHRSVHSFLFLVTSMPASLSNDTQVHAMSSRAHPSYQQDVAV